ncbi:transport protein Avl9-domain-containing protein [Mycena floridula]|nr:transport protein Avl9-domain-containing protein [Mycena floridula]
MEPSVQPSSPSSNRFHKFMSEDDDGDTASQRSISLSSPAHSARNSMQETYPNSSDFLKRASQPSTLNTDLSSEPDDGSMFAHDTASHESPTTSIAPSILDEPKELQGTPGITSYPPLPQRASDGASIMSFNSTTSRKARPESMLIAPSTGPLILGIALVDFNHLVGPRIEWSKGEIFEDEELAKILPFLALPDGAHMSAEDYTYFHLVPSTPNPTTLFGISCNQQIAASALLVKTPDVTRSTVQKAVVVLASKPLFGPIRDKLGVVTTALFQQRDFTTTQILDDFEAVLEPSVRGQLTESGFYMGTNLRQLVHTFRQRTLLLVKALMLQKRILFFGHPVERLCTFQYSLVSLLPGLLQTLEDCGSPPLASRAPSLTRPSSLKTSDSKSMMAYMGLPLDIFGQDAFFQPYLPLQQLDMLKDSKSWLCGTTNSIVTQQKEIDLLVDIENGVFEFRDPRLERLISLTAADRKWMDDIVRDVNDNWNEEDPSRPLGIQFKGSDDYLRSKFEEYVHAALASVKYRDFVAKGEGSGVLITGGTGGDSSSTEDFNPLWIADFKQTNAYEVWQRVTDPLLFDIVEPRHPCNEKPTVVSDIGLRLQEGIQDLKLEQQLAPAREAVAQTIKVGSANFFKAVEGVRERWGARTPSSGSSSMGSPVEVTKADLEAEPQSAPATAKPLFLAKQATVEPPITAAISSWGSGIGTFISSRAGRFSFSGKTPKPADIHVSPASKSASLPPVPRSSTDNVSPPPLPKSPVNGSYPRSLYSAPATNGDVRSPLSPGETDGLMNGTLSPISAGAADGSALYHASLDDEERGKPTVL